MTSSDVETELGAFRPELLRHCYRMLGSFAEAEDLVQDVLLRAWRARATYAGDAPVVHWLMRIATNACLTALTQRRRRELPQLDREPVDATTPPQELPSSQWITPAPDARLFPSPAAAVETRESVAIAFVALLQRLPPRQRAVLLLKDVVGWSADEIAAALELTVSSVNSALHRARETIASHPVARADEPPPEVLRAYVRSWEERDVDSLIALLRRDVVFAMPPHSIWFRGASNVEAFVHTPRFSAFWSRGVHVAITRANGLPALALYLGQPDGALRRHSLQVVRFVDRQLAEATTFIGDAYLHGFDLADTFDRTVSGAL
jgi:RNA polymerase sigma-70 factor (ECF subfamily)